MADDATRLKTISDNIEESYQQLRVAASHIAGLLQTGSATCDEIRAYNLWALAIYNTQKGMLLTLRANGEQNIPALPVAPTLFAWRGVSGDQAVNISCAGQASSLSGVMGRVLKGPTAASQYLSLDQIEIQTQDQDALNPAASPSFATLYNLQMQRQGTQPNALGFVPIIIAIAGIAIAVAIAVKAIMDYLKATDVAEENTKQVALQAAAFANYTAARLSCMSKCTATGQSQDDCADTCAKVITKPDIKLPGTATKWGALQWIGFTVVAGVGAMATVKIVQRHREGRPIFALPDQHWEGDAA